MDTSAYLDEDAFGPTTVASEEGFSLILSHRGRDRSYHYWLLEGEVPVSYIRVYFNLRKSGQVELCDIETREGHRNLGHAKRLMAMVAQAHGVEGIVHNGGYTPDGFAYIASKVTRDYGESEACYSQMDFVEDWALLRPRW